MTTLCFDLCKKDERFCDGPILKLAAAKSGKKDVQDKEVPSHSLSKHICLLLADLSKVVKKNALSGFGVVLLWNFCGHSEPCGRFTEKVSLSKIVENEIFTSLESWEPGQ